MLPTAKYEAKFILYAYCQKNIVNTLSTRNIIKIIPAGFCPTLTTAKCGHDLRVLSIGVWRTSYRAGLCGVTVRSGHLL